MAINEIKLLEVINMGRAKKGQPPLRYLGERDPRAVVKLTHAERCQILAFWFCGVPDAVTAAAFDVSIQTVWRIGRTGPKIYPQVFAEKMQFATQWEYCARHITEEKEKAVREMYPQFQRPPKDRSI